MDALPGTALAHSGNSAQETVSGGMGVPTEGEETGRPLIPTPFLVLAS